VAPHLVPLALILGAVALANGPGLVHLVTTNPLALNAALAPAQSGWLPGLPFIDGNAGFTTQALGHLAASDWLHGHIPWWNPYEGVGSPLAGEMQSGAFFPLTVLLLFHQGLLIMQLVLEVMSGWSTYFLIRRLGVGRSLATAGGVAFGLCGTFAWLAHAPIRPAALLPLCLVGVERAIDAARDGRRNGWRLLAVALALSILAGFPETTLIDGLFVAWWAVLRLGRPRFRPGWRAGLVKLGTGLLVGVGLAAPLIIAFADYLPYGYTGGHGGEFAHMSLPSVGLAQLILPYSFGPIFGFFTKAGSPDPIAALWGSVGGFLSVSVIAAGLVGVIGRRGRTLRLGLAGWIAVCLLRTFGFPPVVHLMAVIPGVRLTAFFRYSDPSWELAAVVLAALGLDDIARSLTRRRALIVGALVTGALAVWAAVTAVPLMNQMFTPTGQLAHRQRYPIGSAVAAGIALVLLVIGGVVAGRTTGDSDTPRRRARRDRERRIGRLLMAGTMAVESMLLFGFTYLSAPPPTALATGSVHWLQTHLGTDRFLTLGPIQPNYGSYFGIAQANINDLPVPKAWNNYIATRLDPNALPGVFSGGGRIDPAGPTAAQELTTHLANYEAVGVRYVVETSNGEDVQGQAFPAGGAPPWPAGPRLVYRDHFAEIWQLPAAAPTFSLRPRPGDTGNGPLPSSCTVTGRGWDRATVHCSRPSLLTRNVLFMPGWTASGGTRSTTVQEDRAGPAGLFQAVAVPAGTTTLDFSYRPPHAAPAEAAALVAAIVLLGSFAPFWRRRSRGARPREDG
jgi:hypothetical protein